MNNFVTYGETINTFGELEINSTFSSTKGVDSYSATVKNVPGTVLLFNAQNSQFISVPIPDYTGKEQYKFIRIVT